jgi:hypothetical protein
VIGIGLWEREGGPRAEDGAAGDAERERDIFFPELHDHRGGPDGDENRPADTADDSEESEFGLAA